MSDQEIEFLPYEHAKKIVGNVIEEEHLHEANRRILTVYDHSGKELCWYDADDVMKEVEKNPGKKVKSDQEKEADKVAAVEYVLHHIPAWPIG